MRERACLDCGGDISMRGPRAIRCPSCAQESAKAQRRASARRHRDNNPDQRRRYQRERNRRLKRGNQGM